ncbi:MAG: Rieske (2Fe-2S) protein [Pseudomonadota bacterium]
MRRRYLCRAEEVPRNEKRVFHLEDGPPVLVLNWEDEFFACQARCPHQDASLQDALFDGSLLTCDQHLWQWDIRTGSPVGLAEAPIQRYELEVEEGSLYIASQ